MKSRIDQKRGRLGFIIILITFMTFGCKEMPTLVEFLEMSSTEADQLNVAARYQVVQEILWVLDDPVGENDVRLLDITFDDRIIPNKYTLLGYDSPALISIQLTGKTLELMESISWEGFLAPGTVIEPESIPIPDIDEAAVSEVRLTFDFEAGESAWGTEPLDGLNGHSEMDLLGLLTEFARPYVQTALARYTKATDASIRVVRAEGAPFLASYSQESGELALNPNYLRLVSLLPPSALTLFAEDSGKGPKHFILCMQYLWHTLLRDISEIFYIEELCEEFGIFGWMFCLVIELIFGSFFAPIIATVMYIILIPAHITECFPFFFQCGTMVSGKAGILPLAVLVLLPLMFIRKINRKGSHRSPRH